jgi:hypothetical protein
VPPYSNNGLKDKNPDSVQTETPSSDLSSVTFSLSLVGSQGHSSHSGHSSSSFHNKEQQQEEQREEEEERCILRGEVLIGDLFYRRVHQCESKPKHL